MTKRELSYFVIIILLLIVLIIQKKKNLVYLNDIPGTQQQRKYLVLPIMYIPFIYYYTKSKLFIQLLF